MVRKRIEGTLFTCWNDVDAALMQIGGIDRELGLLESSQNERIDQIKTQTKDLAEPLLTKKAGLELAVKEYCKTNKAEFAKVKTKTLTFGEVGFRISTKIMIKSVADTLQSLKDLALNSCIRVKEEIDKEAMKALTDETLAEVGAAKKIENVFGYTLNVERINGEVA
jgi:phage host-nuclease inhibitor protein Gam